MRITIRGKILVVFLFLTLVVIVATSGVYYYLFTRDIRELSRKQITIAFEMMFDDFVSQANSAIPRVEKFMNDSLLFPLFFLYDLREQVNRSWDNQNMGSMISTYMSRLKSITESIDAFSPLLGASECLLYDWDRKLIALSRRTSDRKALGFYLHQVHGGTFIPMHTEEEVSAVLRSIENIPKIDLPAGVLATYEGDIPDIPTAVVGKLGETVTIQFIIPIFRQEVLLGIYVIHIRIEQSDIERFSRFSQTRINIFTDAALSVGMLSAERNISYDESVIGTHIDLLNLQNMPPIDFSEVLIGEQEYYQGKIILGDGGERIGAMTTNFPRQIEKEKRQALLKLIAGVIIVLGTFAIVISIILSSRIVQPIASITTLIQQIMKGDLTGIVEEQASDSMKKSEKSGWHEKDEVKILSQAFYEMVVYLRDIAEMADTISRGEIHQTMTPRSEHDMLGHAFQRMSEYIREITSVATAIADGDLRQDFQPKSRHDVLGNAFHKMSTLRQTMSQIMDGSQHVRTASESLNQISVQMASDAEQASHKVHGVSDTSHQINQIVDGVATAVEEFSASIREISRNTSESANITDTAVNIANSASTAITDLEVQSQEIGEISKVITTITQQTNLLALNATIEAARAGEAGKGFAIVASEVKTLAKEVATSTENITHKIATIQASSQKAVNAIGEVSKIITQVNDISNAIASSVEQQSATANEIARSVAHVATGSDDVTSAMSDVSTVTQSTSEQAARVQKAANELTRLADQLQQLVGKFQI